MASLDAVVAAIEQGDREALVSALDESPELASATCEDGAPVLIKAIYHGQKDMVPLIVARMTELDVFTAAASGSEDALMERLREEPDLINARAHDGFTALHLAAFFGGPGVVRILLDAGADPSITSDNPMQVLPLNSAVAGGHAGSVRALLAAGADVNAVQQQGVTPLMGAAASGRREIVEVLLAAGAEKAARSADGTTAADYARQRGHEDLTPLLES